MVLPVLNLMHIDYPKKEPAPPPEEPPCADWPIVCISSLTLPLTAKNLETHLEHRDGRCQQFVSAAEKDERDLPVNADALAFVEVRLRVSSGNALCVARRDESVEHVCDHVEFGSSCLDLC